MRRKEPYKDVKDDKEIMGQIYTHGKIPSAKNYVGQKQIGEEDGTK